jgi:hypothetical protein
MADQILFCTIATDTRGMPMTPFQNHAVPSMPSCPDLIRPSTKLRREKLMAIDQKNIEKALVVIENTDDLKKLDNLENNARKKGVSEIVQAAVHKKLKLAGRDYSDPLERELQEAVAAREHLLYLKHGRSQPASYTRRMIKNGKPVKNIIIDWIMDNEPTTGFKDFVESGIAQFAAENIAIRHFSHFPETVVEKAKQRLIKYTK